MKSSKKLFSYILLNIFVSALTTLVVLWAWKYFLLKENAPQSAVQTPPSASSAIPTAQTAVQNSNEPLIEIENVFGVGVLDTEVVALQRLGEGELSLTNWKLKDEDGNTYKFPQLILNAQGSVQIYTKFGVDSVVDLHWGLENAIWETGETVTLVNEKGQIQAEYKIP